MDPNLQHLFFPDGPTKDLSVARRHNNLFSNSPSGTIYHVWEQSSPTTDMDLFPLSEFLFPTGVRRWGDVFSVMLPTGWKEDPLAPRPSWRRGQGLAPWGGQRGCLRERRAFCSLPHPTEASITPLSSLAGAFPAHSPFTGHQGDLPTRPVRVNQCRGNF